MTVRHKVDVSNFITIFSHHLIIITKLKKRNITKTSPLSSLSWINKQPSDKHDLLHVVLKSFWICTCFPFLFSKRSLELNFSRFNKSVLVIHGSIFTCHLSPCYFKRHAGVKRCYMAEPGRYVCGRVDYKIMNSFRSTVATTQRWCK